MATKHNIEIKVFIDGKKLCNTGSVTDTYDGGRCGIGMELDALEGKDREYVRKALVKQAECLIKYAEFMTKTGKFTRNTENVSQ